MPAHELDPILKEFFLGWLLDPRPEGRTTLTELPPGGGGVRLWIDEDAPEKGTLTQVAEALGVSRETLRLWRKDPRFQKLYREAVAAEMADPTHMLGVMRKLRSIAQGDDYKAKPADITKAAETYARLTGYVVESEDRNNLRDLPDEELEKIAAEERRLALVK